MAPMNTNDATKASRAIFLRRASSFGFKGFGELVFLESPLIGFRSTSARNSEAAVEALVDDLSLPDMIIVCVFYDRCYRVMIQVLSRASDGA